MIREALSSREIQVNLRSDKEWVLRYVPQL